MIDFSLFVNIFADKLKIVPQDKIKTYYNDDGISGEQSISELINRHPTIETKTIN